VPETEAGKGARACAMRLAEFPQGMGDEMRRRLE
jgi:hypothetical protein